MKNEINFCPVCGGKKIVVTYDGTEPSAPMVVEVDNLAVFQADFMRHLYDCTCLECGQSFGIFFLEEKEG